MGKYTPNNFFYLPDYGASGEAEKQKFDDALNNTDTELKDLKNKKHTQNTDQYLDYGGPNQVAVADAKDAVDKKHQQNTDQYLDYGGPNQVAVADAKDAVDKRHVQNTDHIIQDTDADTFLNTEETADADTLVGKVAGVEAFRIHNNGIVDLPKQSAVVMYAATSQTIPTGSFTKITLDTVAFDVQGEADTTNSRITFTKDGKYLVIGQVRHSLSTTVTDQIIAAVYKNGADVTPCIWNVISAETIYPTPNAAGLIDVVAGDYIELYTYQYTGADQATQASARTFLAAVKVA